MHLGRSHSKQDSIKDFAKVLRLKHPASLSLPTECTFTLVASQWLEGDAAVKLHNTYLAPAVYMTVDSSAYLYAL